MTTTTYTATVANYTATIDADGVSIYDTESHLLGTGTWDGSIQDCLVDLGDDVYDALAEALIDAGAPEAVEETDATWTITYEPTDVAVADDRGTVAGAMVTIEHPEYDTDTIEVIPPEGHTADCWLGHDGYAYPEEIWDALGEAAKAGARGESGTIEV